MNSKQTANLLIVLCIAALAGWWWQRAQHPVPPVVSPGASGGLTTDAARAEPAAESSADGPVPVAAVSPAPTAAPKGLHFAEVPAEATQLVAQRIGRKRQGLTSSGWINGLDMPAESNVAIEPGIPEYVISGSSRPVVGPDLDAATFSRYYYPITEGGKLVRTVTVMNLASTGALGVGAVGITSSTAILDAVRRAQGLAEVQAGSFEVRLLHYNNQPMSPATTLLWLKSAPGGTDLLYDIPYTNATPNTRPVPPPPIYATQVPVPGTGDVADVVTGTFDCTIGPVSFTQALTLTVGQTAVIPLNNNGVTAELVLDGAVWDAGADGKTAEQFTSAGGARAGTSFSMSLRDISIAFTAAPASQTAPSSTSP